MCDTQDKPQYLLEVTDASKRFPGVLALDRVSLAVRKGEVHALMGENGAGKSTLMKIIGGIYKPDSGTMVFDGKPYQPKGPADAQEHGVSLIHQELNLVPDLTVAQNIYLGREPAGKAKILMSEKTAIRSAKTLLDSIGVSFSPKAYVRDLSVAQQQMVEIAKALSFHSRLLVMDEPTAALSDREVDKLFQMIQQFLSPQTAVIYISHRLEELMKISDRITIFRDGAFIKEMKTNETNKNEIVKLMVGREISAYTQTQRVQHSSQPVLVVKHISNKRVNNVSLTVKAGEILGIGGLEGAGRTELARAIIGADKVDGGEVFVDGKAVRIRKPYDAVSAGIAYLSEDRKRDGLILDESISKNVALPSLKSFVRHGFISNKPIEKLAGSSIQSLHIRTPSSGQLTKNLSGGNQQKVVVAKWLAKNSRVLIFDEPTRGIDVGAKQEIYALLDQLAQQGHAIVVISSEMEELLSLSDRIIVMCNGKATGELSREEATQEKIMMLATAFSKTKTN